jgi:putative ABC transport system permease protein
MNPLQRLLHRRAQADDLSEEMRQHLEEKIEALVAGGVPRDEAVHAARRAFGNATLIEQRSREVWMWPLIESIWADIKFALRQLRKSPGFALTAVLTLALGIGATTAIFSLFQQVWLHSLPVPNPERLVLLRATGPMDPGYESFSGEAAYYFSVPMFRDLRKQSGNIFSGMAASGRFDGVLRAGTTTKTVRGYFVTGGYFDALGLRPMIGRLISPEDDTVREGNPVAVLSYSEWQQAFGGSPAALNQVVDINAHPFTIIGVAPAGFVGLDRQNPAQIFAPMSMEPTMPTHDRSFLDLHNAIWINIVARLQPWMSAQRAEVALNPVWRSLRTNELTLFKHNQRFAEEYLHSRLSVENGAEGLPFLQHRVGPEIQVLIAMALMVLLIACVNLANLLLVRGAVRAKEIGVRAALGASRARLMRWVLIDGFLLTALGGLAGACLGLLAMPPLTTSGLLDDSWDAAPVASAAGMHLLLFAAAAMLLTWLLSCLPSMLLSTRPDLNQVLHESTVRNPRGASRVRPVFTAFQIVLSFVLLVGASLLARTLYNLKNIDVGMQTDHVLQFSTDARSTGASQQASPALMQQIADAIRREPGVSSVAYAADGILSGDMSRSDITIAGHPLQEDDDAPDRNSVNADFFSTLGIPLLAGRVFRYSDEAGAPKVAVVNEMFAKHYFGSVRNALGQMFCFGTGTRRVPDTTIVGVVQNARSINLDVKPDATLYITFTQEAQHQAEFYVRTEIAPELVANEVRQAVRSVNSALPLDDFETLNEQIAGDVATPRLLAALSISFGLLAALLAAIGLYGVLAYSTTQRTREIGIRMALGANRGDVVRLVLRQVAWITGAALAVGVPLGLLLSRYLRKQLFNVAYNDPWSFVAAALFLFLVIAAAAYGPAKRAAMVDPMQALRAE